MIIPAFLVSLFIAAIVAPLIIRLYTSRKWIDDPAKQHHVKITHQSPVPRGGGLVILVAVLLSCLLFLNLNSEIFWILLGTTILAAMGTLDDIKNLNPYLRFVVGLLVAGFIVFAGIKIEYITHPFQTGVIYIDHPSFIINGVLFSFNLPFLSTILTVLWIVWNMNIVNWSKGIDGQLPGVVGIASIFIGILAIRFSADPAQQNVILLAFIVAGAYLGLLIWNAYPQKIMPGYGAGSLGGYFLAILAILSGAKLATSLLVLALPTADAIFTITRRLLRKKSPFWGDRGHLHHKLMDVLGWSKRTTAFFYWMVTALMGFIALQLKPEQKLFTIVVVSALVFGFLIWAKLFITSSKQHDQDSG
ncbi:MAG: MraY family glycosyltransferase [Patescibacteria group bacterium]